MRRKHGASLAALGLLVLAVGLAAVAGTPPPDGRPPAAELRREYPREESTFLRWLKETVRTGRTTQREILDLLGTRCKYLDRPARDGVFAFEYDLATLGVRSVQEGFLVFEFDRRDRVLEYYFLSLGVCGFCPHVFADDGAWRLEGKLLAGCVGSGREGTDTLLLPRALPRHGKVRVRLANHAPEVEFLDSVVLGRVALGVGEEVDVDSVGRPYLWTPAREITEASRAPTVPLGSGPGRVLVLEVRNTTAFEYAMREHFLGGAPEPAGAALPVTFDDDGTHKLAPVGSKFLRRVVVPVPPRARAAHLPGTNPLWEIRRAWSGTGRIAEAGTFWHAPVAPATAADLLRQPDGRRLRLDPAREVVLTFTAPDFLFGGGRWGFLLRFTGYYEFLPPTTSRVR
jgi:hypothetical protein